MQTLINKQLPDEFHDYYQLRTKNVTHYLKDDTATSMAKEFGDNFFSHMTHEDPITLVPINSSKDMNGSILDDMIANNKYLLEGVSVSRVDNVQHIDEKLENIEGQEMESISEQLMATPEIQDVQQYNVNRMQAWCTKTKEQLVVNGLNRFFLNYLLTHCDPDFLSQTTVITRKLM